MSWKLQVLRIQLTTDEDRRTRSVLRDLLGDRQNLPLSKLVEAGHLYAQELPRNIRAAFHAFRREERYHALCVAWRAPEEEVIGPTPLHHRPPNQDEQTNIYETLHYLYASLLGQPFAWSTIQNGYLFNDVMPVAEHETLPASSGFRFSFGLHTEDAFHPNTGDYLGLFCLRNPGAVQTIFAGFDPSTLSAATLRRLFIPDFIVGANIAQEVDEVTYLSPLLFGTPEHPYMRINLNDVRPRAHSPEAAVALEEFRSALLDDIVRVAFQAGEYWYIDNYRVAHGRDAYTPQLDGTDRWLKRLYITSAFRRSIHLRRHPENIILDPSKSEVRWCW